MCVWGGGGCRTGCGLTPLASASPFCPTRKRARSHVKSFHVLSVQRAQYLKIDASAS